MEQEKKICILIIFSPNVNYDKMFPILHNYYSQFKNVVFYFTQMREQEQPIELDSEKRMIYVKGKEGLLNILKKSLESMKYILKEHIDEFDFLIRTNISTVINMELLAKFLSNIPPTKYYGGGHLHKCVWGSDKRLYGDYYSQGTGIIFSKDIVEDMCTHADRFEYDIIDDVSFGRYVRKYHGDIFENTNKYTNHLAMHIGCNCCKRPSEEEIEEKCIFYRNRRWGDRPSDVVEMDKLCKKFIPKADDKSSLPQADDKSSLPIV
jgi:hypothetical protein